MVSGSKNGRWKYDESHYIYSNDFNVLLRAGFLLMDCDQGFGSKSQDEVLLRVAQWNEVFVEDGMTYFSC